MYTEILLAVVAVSLCLWYRQRKKHFRFFKDLGFRGPEPNIFFGNLLEIFRKGTINSQQKWVKTYGKVVGYYYGTTPVLLVADLDLLKNVLIKDFQKFTDRPFIFREIGSPGVASDRKSQHLINIKGKKWKEIRSLVTPSFTSSKMKLMYPIIDNCIDILLESIEEKRLSGKAFDMFTLYKRLTMDVIIKTAFGVKTNVQKNPNDPFIKLTTLLFTAPFRWLYILMAGSFGLIAPLLSLLRNISGAAANKGYNPIEELLDRCEAIIKERMKDPSQKRTDLLQLLIDAELKEEDKVSIEALAAGEASEKLDIKKVDAADANQKKRRLTIDQMVANSFVFLIAGFETTSTALAFSTMMFVNYPDVQEKVRAEVNALLEKEGKLDYGSISQLEYLDQVFCEILRLYPPVYQFVNREATEDVVFEKLGIGIPKGTIVQSPTYLLHHDPDNWPEPEEFNPERFSPENRKKINPLAWQPFGAGPRNCVGMRFAQMEAKLAIAKILHKYILLPTKKTDQFPLDLNVFPLGIRPKYGVPIAIKLAT